MNKQTQFMIQRLRQEHFHHNNKCGKYQANQIKRNKEKSTISVIKGSAGKPTSSPDQINEIFYKFYSNLYSSEINPSQEDINSFLNCIDVPQLNEAQTKLLDLLLTQNEFITAPNLMPNNRAPGPDGFPAEFYKHFWPIIAPLFNWMIPETKQNSKFPTNMNTAMTSLLLKPNKDPTLPSSNRPISLINVDVKIISKALAHRAEKVIASIIHPDQTGFIKDRLNALVITRSKNHHNHTRC